MSPFLSLRKISQVRKVAGVSRVLCSMYFFTSSGHLAPNDPASIILALEATVFVIESVAMVEVHERLS